LKQLDYESLSEASRAGLVRMCKWFLLTNNKDFIEFRCLRPGQWQTLGVNVSVVLSLDYKGFLDKYEEEIEGFGFYRQYYSPKIEVVQHLFEVMNFAKMLSQVPTDGMTLQ
jgi:hypothetical protein